MEVTAATLEFPTGSSDGSMQCVEIVLIDDNTLEEDETFTVSLVSLDSDVVPENAVTNITIKDDDGTYILAIIIP